MRKHTSLDDSQSLRGGLRLEVPAPPSPGTPMPPPPPAAPPGPDVPSPEIIDPVPAENPVPVREPPVMPTPMAKSRGRWADSPRVIARTRYWAGAAGTLH